MQVLLVCGSVRPESCTRALARRLETCLHKEGARTTFWDLGSEPLPIADPAYHRAPDRHPDAVVRRFVQEAQRADAFSLATPLYHGSYSGVLKNALDHLRYDAFRNKVVALLSHGGGIRSCTQPCEHLRSVVRTLYGYSTQTQVASSSGDFSYDRGTPDLVNAELGERLERLAAELCQMAHLLSKHAIAKED
jgi:NAD(P)H-dependent FMN reductase